MVATGMHLEVISMTQTSDVLRRLPKNESEEQKKGISPSMSSIEEIEDIFKTRVRPVHLRERCRSISTVHGPPEDLDVCYRNGEAKVHFD